MTMIKKDIKENGPRNGLSFRKSIIFFLAISIYVSSSRFLYADWDSFYYTQKLLGLKNWMRFNIWNHWLFKFDRKSLFSAKTWENLSSL